MYRKPPKRRPRRYTELVSFKVTKDLLAKLTRLAVGVGRNQSEYLRELLEDQPE